MNVTLQNSVHRWGKGLLHKSTDLLTVVTARQLLTDIMQWHDADLNLLTKPVCIWMTRARGLVMRG